MKKDIEKSFLIINTILEKFNDCKNIIVKVNSLFVTINNYDFNFYHETCMCHGFRLTVSCDKLRYGNRIYTEECLEGYDVDNEHLIMIPTRLIPSIEEALNAKFMFGSTEYGEEKMTWYSTTNFEDGILMALNRLPQRDSDYSQEIHKYLKGTSLKHINKDNIKEEVLKIEKGTRFQHPNPNCYILWESCLLEKDRCYITLKNNYNKTYIFKIIPFEADLVEKVSDENE